MSGMRFYWPCAVTVDGQKLFTYNAVLTLEKAIKQIAFWEEELGLKLKRAWVDVDTEKHEFHKINGEWMFDEEKQGNG